METYGGYTTVVVVTTVETFCISNLQEGDRVTWMPIVKWVIPNEFLMFECCSS